MYIKTTQITERGEEIANECIGKSLTALANDLDRIRLHQIRLQATVHRRTEDLVQQEMDHAAYTRSQKHPQIQ